MTVRWLIVAVLAVVSLGIAVAFWRDARDVSDLPVDPAVTAATIAQTICVSGYSKTVRPASSVMARIKAALIRTQGDDVVIGASVLDHRIPLAIGGAARDVRNLQIQSLADGKRKDRIEKKLHCLVCAGQVALADAQHAIYRDWEAAYTQWAAVKCLRPGRRRSAPDPSPQ